MHEFLLPRQTLSTNRFHLGMLPLDRMINVQKLIQDKSSYGTMNLFGIIVYTEANPYVAKVLRDQDFWKSLNMRTKDWILYALEPKGEYGHLTENYILPQLGIKDSHELPQLVMLALGPETDGILKQQGFLIDDKDLDSTYHSIEEQINVITDAASRIYPEYRSSTNVHREVVRALDTDRLMNKWKKAKEPFQDLVKVILSMSGFLLK